LKINLNGNIKIDDVSGRDNEQSSRYKRSIKKMEKKIFIFEKRRSETAHASVSLVITRQRYSALRCSFREKPHEKK